MAEQIQQFRRTVGRHGFTVEVNRTKSETSIEFKNVCLSTDVNQAMLIDEYSHVWNHKLGRGRFLEGAMAERHKELGAIAELVGTKGFTDPINIEFHQLELRNLLHSGGALPSFFNGVSLEQIHEFLRVEP
jgi:hypothetical protein